MQVLYGNAKIIFIGEESSANVFKIDTAKANKVHWDGFLQTAEKFFRIAGNW